MANGMETLGSRLEEARKRKGVSIREASEATKIRTEYLSQFEGDDFDIPLPPIYQRGFVKIYARYLGEDADECISEVQARLNRTQALGAKGDVRASLGQMDLASRRRQTAEQAGETTGVAIDDGVEPESGPRWKIPQIRMPSLRSAPRADDEYDDLEETGEPLDRTFYLKVAVIVGSVTVAVVLLIALAKVVFGGGGEPQPINPDLSTETSQAEVVGDTAAPPPPGGGEIVLRATGGPTWVQVNSAATDELVGRVSLAAGESRTFEADGEVLVLFTQGENLEVERAGEVFAPSRSGSGKIRIE